MTTAMTTHLHLVLTLLSVFGVLIAAFIQWKLWRMNKHQPIWTKTTIATALIGVLLTTAGFMSLLAPIWGTLSLLLAALIMVAQNLVAWRCQKKL